MSFLSQKKPEMAGMLSTSLEVGRVADKMPVRVESAEPILLSLSKYQEEDGAQAAQAKDKGKWSGTMAGMLSTSLEVGRVADKMPVRVESAEPILLSLSKYQEEDGAQAAQAKDKGKWSGTNHKGTCRDDPLKNWRAAQHHCSNGALLDGAEERIEGQAAATQQRHGSQQLAFFHVCAQVGGQKLLHTYTFK
uniref:uncharacterized protein isoform X3 n=1 Tax=Myxine glutinosa TaxID=7769 RepID=UPI00358EA1E8